jgi:L-aminopeptidase/D-esterase-like protein
MLTDVKGVRVGHYTDTENLTGCTVILCPENTVGSGEIRGNSPGSRETALLGPDKSMQQVNAILLTGGSAFGLAAADGVVRYLSERDIGYKTPWAKVPIVPAAVVFDLNVGSSSVRPGVEEGYAACLAVSDMPFERGAVGAGMGTTVGKWLGPDYWMKGGLGTAVQRNDTLIVAAIAVVNSVGDVYDTGGKILAGARHPDGGFWAEVRPDVNFIERTIPLEMNTTLVVVATNAKLTKLETHKICQRAHTGMARAVKPVNTSYDGDCIFGLATGHTEAYFELIAELAAEVTAEAIRDGVRSAKTTAGIPGLGG